MYLRLLGAAGLSFGLDRLTKMLVSRGLAPGQSVAVTSWLTIRRVTAAPGLALFRQPRLQVLVLAALFSGLCLIDWHGRFFQRPAAQLGLGLALGGAASNVYDQLRSGAVTDFLDLGWWPVFNLADAAITLGVIIALLWFF
jgi:signal peptidase II